MIGTYLFYYLNFKFVDPEHPLGVESGTESTVPIQVRGSLPSGPPLNHVRHSAAPSPPLPATLDLEKAACRLTNEPKFFIHF